MTAASVSRRVVFAALLAASGIVSAQAISVATLQRLLQRAPDGEVAFLETRESPWLATPVESSGTMRHSAEVLEKRVEKPRRETWRILEDRMQLGGADNGAVKEILFADSPLVAALANALRRVMAGDLQALDKDFRLVADGEERLWTLQLTPRRSDIARYLKQLELQGTGAYLQVIVILENQGGRTTTRLIQPTR